MLLLVLRLLMLRLIHNKSIVVRIGIGIDVGIVVDIDVVIVDVVVAVFVVGCFKPCY